MQFNFDIYDMKRVIIIFTVWFLGFFLAGTVFSPMLDAFFQSTDVAKVTLITCFVVYSTFGVLALLWASIKVERAKSATNAVFKGTFIDLYKVAKLHLDENKPADLNILNRADFYLEKLEKEYPDVGYIE